MTRLLKNLFNQRSAAWILSLAMIVATVGGPLALLLPLPNTQAQNAQNTDIFTGQFIPAYLGAAYDPTEAYKVMAGMEVLVFAYDRWDTIVNNYVHRSQVKADGSFQAAGLPNASHYGICIIKHDFFRAPETEDGIQSAFAYNLQDLNPSNTGIRSQTRGEDDNLKTCKTFTTSSRLADIKNHVNIFPLVPKTVLSVIIQDQLTNDSFYNNGPYEIYAQRISTSSASYAAPQQGVIDKGSIPEITTKTGPIIRGRSIKLNNSHTIFQAFAPEGNYAITYWRPDSRNANAQITYLTYDGVASLGTSQNGIAFEAVYEKDQRFIINGEEMLAWKMSSYIKTDIKNPWKNVWGSSLGSINIWGVITGTDSGIVRPQPGKYLSTSSSQLGFYDVPNGKCVGTSPQKHNSNSYGVYLLTSACPPRSTASEDGSITTTVSVLRDANATAEISSISVSVNGKEGPARRDISLIDIPDSALTGSLTRDNSPFAFARIDLKIGNTLYKKVAQADSTGFFYIPQHYFTKNPNLPHQIIATPSYDPPNFNKRYQNIYAIDSQTVLALSQGKGANYNTIAINKTQPSQLQTMLANLTLDNLLAQIRIPSVLAQTTSINYSKESFEIDGSNGGAFILYLNLDTLGKSINVFNSANYHLRTVELNPPTDVKSLSGEAPSSELDEHQELFDRHEGTYGVITTANAASAVENINGTGNGNDPKDNNLIVGVALKSTSPEAIAQLFRDYGTTSLNFNLRLSFQYRGGASTAGIDQIGDSQLNNINQDTLNNLNGLVGQDASSAPPQVLEASWPITLTWAGEGSNNYEVKYDPIALTPAAAKCQSGSWRDPMGFVEGLLCKTVMGGIHLTQQAISWIADSFLTVDPLNGMGSGIVIKYWNVMRNFVNSLAVLILVASGIAIMMRYEPKTFRIQNVITKLIIAIVLVNFSILIIQLILDIINVFALGGFYMLIDSLGSNGTAISAGKAATSLATIFAAQIIAAMAVPGPGWIGMMVAIFGVILLFGYVIFKIMIHYYLRLAVIWFCIILAPFAFAANILPNTKSLFTKWRGIFTGAVIAQVALAVILSLSYSMISTLTDAKGLMDTILTTLMAFGLLYLATIVPAKASAMYGVDMASGLGAKVMQGFSSFKSRAQSVAINRARKNQEAARLRGALERPDNALDPNYNTRGRVGRWLSRTNQQRLYRQSAGGRVNALLGVNPDEFNKAEDEGEAQSEKVLKANAIQQQRNLIGSQSQAKFNERIKDAVAEKRNELLADNIKYSAPGIAALASERRHMVDQGTLDAQTELNKITDRMTRHDVVEYQARKDALDKQSQNATQIDQSQERMNANAFHGGTLDDSVRAQANANAVNQTLKDIHKDVSEASNATLMDAERRRDLADSGAKDDVRIGELQQYAIGETDYNAKRLDETRDKISQSTQDRRNVQADYRVIRGRDAAGLGNLPDQLRQQAASDSEEAARKQRKDNVATAEHAAELQQEHQNTARAADESRDERFGKLRQDTANRATLNYQSERKTEKAVHDYGTDLEKTEQSRREDIRRAGLGQVSQQAAALDLGRDTTLITNQATIDAETTRLADTAAQRSEARHEAEDIRSKAQQQLDTAQQRMNRFQEVDYARDQSRLDAATKLTQEIDAAEVKKTQDETDVFMGNRATSEVNREEGIKDAHSKIISETTALSEQMANTARLANNRREAAQTTIEKSRAEIASQANRRANPNIQQHEINEIRRTSANAITDSNREANMRIAHPQSAAYRDETAAQKKEYSLADESAGAFLDGYKFTDARKSFAAANASSYTIDNSFIDPTSNRRITLGNVSPGSTYRKGLKKVLDKANNGRGVTPHGETSLINNLRSRSIKDSKGEVQFVNNFQYTNPTTGIAYTPGTEAIKGFLLNEGIYTGSNIDSLTPSDIKGAMLNLVKQQAVKNADTPGWLNIISGNEDQATGTKVPDRAILNTATYGLTLPIRGSASGFPPGAEVIDALPTTIYGKDYENVKKWLDTVNRAYALGSLPSNATTPSLADYNRAIEGLRSANIPTMKIP